METPNEQWEALTSKQLKLWLSARILQVTRAFTHMTVLIPAICWNICRLQPVMSALRTEGVVNMCQMTGE